MSSRPRILLVGPLPIDGDVVEGTKVSFAALAEAMSNESSLDVEIAKLSRPRAQRSGALRTVDEVSALTLVVGRILAPRRRYGAVMLNVSPRGLLKVGRIVRAACRVAGTPLIVHVFGGDLDQLVDEDSTAPRADCLLLQTHALCERFESAADGGRIRWWPTTRDVPRRTAPLATRARKFLFVGQLRREKGIVELIEASHRLPESASLTIVGPSMRGFDIDAQVLGPRCDYRGALPHEDIPGVLSEHDVLVFPSYDAGEGMPGIVVEAMQSGLPVVSTRWRAIPELVDDGESGLLVAPRNVDGLAAAMQRLANSDALFRRVQEGACRTGERFRDRHWHPRLVRWIHELVESGAPQSVSLRDTPAP